MSGDLSLSSDHQAKELSGELSYLSNRKSNHGASNRSLHTSKSGDFSAASNHSHRTLGGVMLGAIEKFNNKSGEASIQSNQTWAIGDHASNRSNRTCNSAASNRSNRTTSRKSPGAHFDSVSLTAASNCSSRSMDVASNRSSQTASIRNRPVNKGNSDKSVGKTESSVDSVSHFYGNGVTVSGGPPDEHFIDEFGNNCSRYVNRTIVINDHMASYAATRSIQGGNNDDSASNKSHSLSFRYRATLFFFVTSTLVLLLLLILSLGQKEIRSSVEPSNTVTNTVTNTTVYYNNIEEALDNTDDFFDEFAEQYQQKDNDAAFETKTARLFEGND